MASSVTTGKRLARLKWQRSCMGGGIKVMKDHKLHRAMIKKKQCFIPPDYFVC